MYGSLEQHKRAAEKLFELCDIYPKEIVLDNEATGYYVDRSGFVYNQNMETIPLHPGYDGYVYVYINRKKLRVHRLVAQAFIPNPENKPIVNHIDSNTTNNKVSNLEWATVEENNQHAVISNHSREDNGKWFYGRNVVGSSHANHKWTDEQIHQVCKMLEDPNAVLGEIHRKTGVSMRTIVHIREHHGWPHIASQYNIYYGPKPQVQPTSQSTIRMKELLAQGLSTTQICDIILKEYPELTRKKIFDRLDYMRHRAERIPKMKKHKAAYKLRQKQKKLLQLK